MRANDLGVARLVAGEAQQLRGAFNIVMISLEPAAPRTSETAREGGRRG